MTCVSNVAPSCNVCVTSLESCNAKMVAPFRGTFKGTIADLKDIDYSTQGNLMRYFKLVDAFGNYMDCCASRHNASSVALVNHVEVIIYFATGRPAIGTASSALFAMSDTIIVPIGTKIFPPLPTNLIEVRTKC